jgi:hypothetical protein
MELSTNGLVDRSVTNGVLLRTTIRDRAPSSPLATEKDVLFRVVLTPLATGTASQSQIRRRRKSLSACHPTMYGRISLFIPSKNSTRGHYGPMGERSHRNVTCQYKPIKFFSGN